MGNGDVDMGTSISTLRDERLHHSSSPHKGKKFRVNLWSRKEGAAHASAPVTEGSLRRAKTGGGGKHKMNWRRTQLIDDDMTAFSSKRPLSVRLPPVEAQPKPRRRARKGEARAQSCMLIGLSIPQ